MSIRNLFDKKIPYSVLSATDVSDLGKEVESSGNITQTLIEKNTFIPDVDYSNPANFAKFGSAERYYTDAIERIYSQYPYDGSLKERAEFINQSTYLDRYIFNERYPRTNGLITIAAEGAHWSPAAAITPATLPSFDEYILFKGGPHAAPSEFAHKPMAQQFPEANLYDVAENRASNLVMDNSKGTTIEFWFKHGPQFPPGSAGTSQEWVVDMVSGSAISAPRQFIYFRSSSLGGFQFRWRQRDDTGMFEWPTDSLTDIHNWHHYAFTSINSGSFTDYKFYVDGELHTTRSTPQTFEAINFVSGTIGSMVHTIGGTNGLGDGKISGSFDEFRYWKTKRTSEDIGRYWFTQVGGGTNTDDANTDLGIYYKFNEGITGRTSTDSNVLDYSGRLTNGDWVGYPGSIARSTDSAMVISQAAKFEFKDPIIYPFDPNVSNLKNELAQSGSVYDLTNNGSIYHSIPGWITEQDENEAGSTLQTLVQIMASYFDTLYLQIEALPKIKDMTYDQSNVKPAPFSNKLLESYGLQAPEIFVNADILAQILNRDEEREFEDKLENIKNLIYKNIYNNLIYIYKSKGTMKSLRNLIHCYGVDTDLIRINAYGDNVNYIFEDNFRPKAERKKYADFNDPDRFQATVYQQTASGNPDSRTFITGQGANTAFTTECEVIFPRKLPMPDADWFPTPFLSASIFGFHKALGGGASSQNFTWAPDDMGLQVYAIRDELESHNAYFQLRNLAGTINLTSSIFPDIYENKKWNLAFRIARTKYGADLVSGSTNPGNYLLEFYGVNSEVDVVANEFYLTQTVDSFATGAFGPKRFYVGAHRTNFTGSLLEKTDLKISSLRFWGSYLDNEVIKAHARDGGNYGTLNPYKNEYLYSMGPFGQPAEMNMPQIETLGLNWNFNNVTSSGDGILLNAYDAGYTVQDLSSGSLALAADVDRFPGAFSHVLNRQHTGRGDFYLANDPKVMDLRYVYSGKQNAPEVVYSSDMIKIMDHDDVVFTTESRPVDYYFQIEKSMYQTISDEMLNVFATIVEFNNLIGEPVNRYRSQYKKMGKLRQLFFESVENTPSLDKYIQFYEWIDASLNVMIQQLLPASSNFSDDIRNMVESHILERNKYKSKFPTLEFVTPKPDFGIKGINELLYNWKHGHAPSSSAGAPSPETENCFWWKERAERDEWPISSSAPGVNTDKEQILSTTLQVLNRRFTTPYRFSVDESPEVRGGVNFSRNKKIDYVKSAIKFGTTTGVSVDDVQPLKDCEDIYNPWKKSKLAFRATTNDTSYFSGKGDIFVPFSLYSSSIYNDVGNNATITNLHTDTYGDDKSVPMQGPFTNYAVGGLQYRHVTPLTPSGSRREGWKFEDNKFTYPDIHDPRGVYYRDEVAKRPVNIRNIHHTTGSTIMGNYDEIYQVVQTCGRYQNNRAFVKAGGFDLEPNYIYSAYVLDIAAIQYARVQRGRTPWVFVNRFSAPGGPDTAGDSNGGPGLDRYSAEYSSNNSLNYRNNFLRNILQKFYTSHVGQFGYYTNTQNINGLPGSKVNAFNYSGTGSLYQINRNPIRQLQEGTNREFQNTTAAWFDLFSPLDFAYMGIEENTVSGHPTWNSGYEDSSDAYSLSGWAYLSSSVLAGTNACGLFQAGDVSGLTAFTSSNGFSISWVPGSNWCINEGWSGNVIPGTSIWNVNSPPPLDQWFNFVWAHDTTGVDGGKTPELYINGVLQATAVPLGFPILGTFNKPSSLCPPGTDMWGATIGAAWWQTDIRTWSGSLDEVAYWKTALTQSDVNEIYGKCVADLDKTDAAPHLVSWWRMGDSLEYGPPDTEGVDGIWHDAQYKNDAIGTSVSMGNTAPMFTAGPPKAGCFTDPGPISCKTVFDNYHIQHPIPRTDCQYQWTKASVAGPELLAQLGTPAHPHSNYFSCVCPTSYWPYSGYSHDNNGLGEIVDTFPAVYFVSGSNFGSTQTSPTVRTWGSRQEQEDPQFMFTDYVGMNHHLVDPLNPLTALIGFDTDVPLAIPFSPSMPQYFNRTYVTFITFPDLPMGLNSLIQHRQGPYGWPTFKQIQGPGNSLVRYYRNNNLIAVNRVPGKTHLRSALLFPPKLTLTGMSKPAKKVPNNAPLTDRFGALKVYKEPAVTSHCFPLTHTLGIRTTVMDTDSPYSTIEPVTIQTTLENNLELFTIKELEYNSNNDPQCDDQAYDTIKKLYLKGALNEPSNPIYSFIEMVYKERVYPTATNAHTKITRERIGYKNDFWKENRSSRTALGKTKWGGS